MGTKYWQEFLIPYNQAVEEIVLKFKCLRDQYRQLGEYSPIENVYGRVKKVSSILEKVKKYGVDIDNIENSIEDIAGIRIICQFEEDIFKVVDIIKKREGKDLQIVKIKDYLSNGKESGYRSYHMIIRYPVFCASGNKDVLVEIQVRTLAMNFWAVVEHSLKYKYKKNIPQEIKKRLRNAAEAVNQLDDEMSKIREEITDAQRLFGLKSSSVSSILHYIGQLYKLGQQDKAERYENIFNELFEKEDIIQLILLRKELEEEVTKRME